jgi:hypothetical protein
MAAANHIDVLISMLQAAKYERDAARMAKSTKEIGDQAEKTGKKAGVGLKQLLKWGATTTVFASAAHYLHGAVEESVNLSKASLQLQRLTGLDVKTSSEWVIIAQQRGIEAQRLGMMFTQLGRVQQRAIHGSKQQASAFEQVGLSVRDLRTLDATGIVTRIADAFERMPNGLQKAALAQQFFGRTGRQLLPLLNQGGVALSEQLDMVEKYGAALEGKTAKDVQQMIVRQRELKIAQLGVREQLADALIPTLTALSAILRGFLVVARPLLRNQMALRIALISLAAAYVVYTASTVAATLATIGFTTVLITTGIGALLIGLGVAIYLVATHWDDLTAAAGRAWSWIKANWEPLAIAIGGPFVVMGIVVVRAVKLITHAIRSISGPVDSLIGKVESIASFGGGIASSIPGFAAGTLSAPGGVAMVGERGPELVNLPRGSQVIPLDRGTAASSSPAGTQVVAMKGDVYLDSRKVGDVLWKDADDRGARR